MLHWDINFLAFYSYNFLNIIYNIRDFRIIVSILETWGCTQCYFCDKAGFTNQKPAIIKINVNTHGVV